MEAAKSLVGSKVKAAHQGVIMARMLDQHQHLPLDISILLILNIKHYFSPLYNIETSPVAHPASHPMGTRGCFLRLKQQGQEADHSPPSSTKAKNGGTVPSLPHAS
jgi:hypothetical protein